MIRAQVLRTLRERTLVEAGDHVLVACSGGPDSTALMHVLHAVRSEVGITVCAASIDHGLRPESASEVVAVEALAERLGIPFKGARLTLDKEGASLQGRARQLRYDALHGLADDFHATKIAVGHTRDDQAETVLARLLRGAGLRGLEGIKPRRADGVIRPLFDCARADVLAYLDLHGLSSVEDPSNRQVGFERVRIREQILPMLREENPRINEHLCALGDEAAELRGLVDRRSAESPPTDADQVAIASLTRLHGPIQVEWLKDWLHGNTGLRPGRAHLVAIRRLLTTDGEVLLRSGWAVRRDGDRLLLEYREHRPTRSNPNQNAGLAEVAKPRGQPHKD